jgi:predicted RNA-binding protein (virulence factor B family)
MITIGKINELKVVECAPDGIWVEAFESEERFIEKSETIRKVKVGEKIDVFVYMAGEDNPVLTMRTPKVFPGEAGVLKVVSEAENGALLDWGMPTLLFVSKREQKQQMRKGENYVVFVRLDTETGNLTGSAKLDKYLSATPGRLHLDQEVDLMIFDESDLGYRAVINKTGLGMIFKSEVFQNLKIGEQTKGLVKTIDSPPAGKLCPANGEFIRTLGA